MHFPLTRQAIDMAHRTPSLAMLPMIMATLFSCAGSAVQASVANVPAAIIFGSCPQRPVWPEAAQREKRQGTVILAFEVDANSTVLDAKVKRSSGHADLDEAARVGLAKCKFRAATQNGSPVRDWAELKYNWVL